MMGTLSWKVVWVCSVAALCAMGLGCSDSGNGVSEDLMLQMDMAETDMAPAEDALTDAEQAVRDLRVALAVSDKIRDAASYGTEELNRVGDVFVTRKLFDWEAIDAVTGWRSQFYSYSSGSDYTSLSQSYRDGSLGWFVPWYDEDGELQVNVGTTLAHRPLQLDPAVWPWRVVNQVLPEVEGQTTTHTSINNHGLGAAWHGIEVNRTYEDAGKLTMRVFTDLAQSDNPGDPFASHSALDPSYPDVVLGASIPDIPAGWDGQWFYAGDGLRGSVDGVPGTFSCAEGDRSYCGIEKSRGNLAPGYIADLAGDPVIFTPDDGSAEIMLPHPAPIPVPTANYLSFGNWLFVPEDITDLDTYDFGMFASGDDPFTVGSLQGLTGTANYAGEASGMYADEVEATLSPFSARVVLAADFGTADSHGTILGTVYRFEIEGVAASPLDSLDLNGAPWRDERNNIFASGPDGIQLPGGWVEGWTSSDEATVRWRGSWGGKFFGNGAGQPSAFAGTFGATDGDRTFAGAFGARQQQ